MSQADLLFTAAFDDQTKAFFDEFDRRMGALGGKADSAFDQTSRGAADAGTQIGFVAGIVGSLTTKLIEMGLQAAKAFPALILEATQLTAQAEVTEGALLALAERSGYSAEKVKALRDQMVAMTFSQDSANQVLLKLVSNEIDLAGAIDLANASLDTATVLGKAEEDVILRATNAIVFQNNRIARGINLSVTAAEVDRAALKIAKEKGIAVENVNMVQARFNATLEKATKFQGAYASAQEKAGLLAEEMPSKVKELKTAFGVTFQEAYLKYLQFMTENIVELTTWLKENEGQLRSWGSQLVFIVGKILEVAEAIIKFAKEIQLFRRVLMGPFNILLDVLPDIDERWANLGTTARQALALIAAGATMIIESLKGIVTTLVTVTKSFVHLGTAGIMFMQGRFVEGKDALVKGMLEFNDSVGQAFSTFEDAGDKVQEVFLEWSTGLGLIEGDTEEVQGATKNLTDDVDKLGEALEEAAEKIKELNEAFAEELAENEIKRMRAAIDRAIREARRREDIARNHQENIAKILEDGRKERREILEEADADERAVEEDFAQERADLAERQTQTLLDIEKNYRRQLEDIRTDFEFTQAELARKNDAVGLLRLMRQTKKRMDEAKTGHDRSVEDARAAQAQELSDLQSHQAAKREEIRRDRAEQLAEFEDDLQERLQKAEEQRLKNIENLERSLAREMEDLIRHRRWQDEDMVRAHQKELEKLGQHFAGVEGLTETHLRALLDEHAHAIMGLDLLWDAYHARRSVAAATARTTALVPSVYGQEEIDFPEHPERLGEWGFQRGGFGIAQRETNVKLAEGGQAEAFAALPLGGTVNHRLSGSASLNVNGVSPQMEAELAPALYDALVGLFQSVRTAA